MKTVREYARGWLERKQPPLVRPSLTRAYRSHLGAILDLEIEVDGRVAVVGDLEVGGLAPRHIEACRHAMLEGGGRSVKTVKNILAGTFRAMLRDARLIDEILERDPFEALKGSWPRERKAPPDPFTAEERNLILDHIKRRHPQHFPLFLFLFETGMRPSEVAALRWGDVDLRAGHVTISKGRTRGGFEAAPKTAASFRSCLLSPVVREVLREMNPLHATEDLHVFLGVEGNPVNMAKISERVLPRVLRALEIRPRKLYSTRHTFISLALTGGANPKGLAEYCGTSLAMIQANYGRFLGSQEGILNAMQEAAVPSAPSTATSSVASVR